MSVTSTPALRIASVSNLTMVLTAAIATIGANSLALGPIAPSVAVGLHTDTVTVMYAAVGYGLGTTGGALCLSPLLDRFDLRRALLVVLGVLILSFTVSAMATRVWQLIAAQTIAGLAVGLGLPAIYSFAALIAPPDQKSQILGKVMVGWTLSLVAGVSLSAVIADMASWSYVYAAFALFALGAAVALGRATLDPPEEQPGQPVLWPHRTLTLSGVSPLLLLCFGYMAAFYGSYAYIGDHVHTVLDMPVRTTALITLAYGTGFGLAVWGDAIIDRVGVSRATPWTFATLVLVYLGLAAGSSAISVLVGVSLIWGIVNHFGLNLIIAGLSAIDPHRRGAILGAYSATTYLAASLSTFTYGWLYAATGFRGVTLVSSALIALVSIAAIQMNRRTALQPLRRRR